MSETYEVLALKYARHADRRRFDNFILADDHASLQPIDFFVWVVRNANRTIVVDTGFDHAEAKRRKSDHGGPVRALRIGDLLKSRRKHLLLCAAVLLTADRSKEVRQRAEDENVTVLHKPLRPAALRSLLSHFYHARQDNRSAQNAAQ